MSMPKTMPKTRLRFVQVISAKWQALGTDIKKLATPCKTSFLGVIVDMHYAAEATRKRDTDDSTGDISRSLCFVPTSDDTVKKTPSVIGESS